MPRPRPLAEEAKHRNHNESSDQVPEEINGRLWIRIGLNREWKIFSKLENRQERIHQHDGHSKPYLSGLCKEGTDLTFSVKGETNKVGDERLT